MFMRKLLAALIAALPVVAFGAYDVTAVMPLTPNGAPTPLCQLYLDGVPAGEPEACDVRVVYPGLLPGDGTYRFSYSLVNAAGETARSIETLVTVSTSSVPDDPTSPPTITVTCADAQGGAIECPSSIQIRIE